MASRRFTTRREMEEHHFRPAVVIGATVLALFASVYLPKLLPATSILDFPLILVIYFSLSRRSPVVGTLQGAATGLLQDTMSNQYIGVNGIAKCIVGYAAASVGLKVDVDNVISRTLLNFALVLLHSAVFYVVERVLLGSTGYPVRWLHEIIRAGVDTAVALPIFWLLDLARIGE